MLGCTIKIEMQYITVIKKLQLRRGVKGKRCSKIIFRTDDHPYTIFYVKINNYTTWNSGCDTAFPEFS